MRKKLPGASSLLTFSFLSAIPFRYVFSRQIEIYKVFKAFPSAAGRTFPAQNIDNSPPPCAKRKISFSQTIFSSAEIKNRKCAIEAEEWSLCEKQTVPWADKTSGSHKTTRIKLTKSKQNPCWFAPWLRHNPYLWITKILQKSGIQKNEVIELIYRGFI